MTYPLLWPIQPQESKANQTLLKESIYEIKIINKIRSEVK